MRECCERTRIDTVSAMSPPFPSSPLDTTPDAERVPLALIRAATVPRRLHLALSLPATVINLARRAIARAHPDVSQDERDLLFVERHYGAVLARELGSHVERRRRLRSSE